MVPGTSCTTSFLVIAAVVFVTGAESSLYKTWSRNTNFGNDANWDPSPPCTGDIISFPETTNHISIFLDVGATVKEMILPLNGEMMFTSSAALVFNDNVPPTLDCPHPGTEVTFSPQARHWFDPGNWAYTRSRPTFTDRRKRGVTSDDISLLDTEKVPCVHDIVSFPSDSSFDVILDADITVSALSYKDRMYTSTEFVEFLNSDDGLNQFSYGSSLGRPTTHITGNSCTDITGCNCGNDNIEMQELICSLKNSSGSTCPSIACRGAFKATGHCCETCGALLTMEYDGNSFTMNAFKEMVENKISDNVVYRNVDAIVSKLWNGKIQVLLVDEEDAAGSDEVAKLFGLALKADIESNMGRYGITTVVIQVSINNSDKTSGDKPLNNGSIAAIIVVLLMLAIICILGFLYVKRKGSFKWWTKRGQAAITDDMVTYSRESEQVDGLATVRGFDNPMYQTTIDTEVKLEAETLGATGEEDEENVYATVAKPSRRKIIADVSMSDVGGGLGFQNPIYDAATVLDEDTQDTFF